MYLHMVYQKNHLEFCKHLKTAVLSFMNLVYQHNKLESNEICNFNEMVTIWLLWLLLSVYM